MADAGTTDLLGSVGFEKSKIGSGDKEVGYQIKESSLGSLVGSLFLCFFVMAALVVMMVYDIRLEKKTLHREVRHVEHHAASKLAQVQMELWSQYRDDVSESREAGVLLKHLEKSYDSFQGKFQTAVNELAQELNLNQERSAKFAEKILHLVADMQQDSVKHAKNLLDHLVKSGARSKKLEKHVDRDIKKNVEEEKQRIKEEHQKPADLEEPPEDGENQIEATPLKGVLKGFWATFNDYDKELGGKVRENFKKGHAVFDQLKELKARIESDNPPAENDISNEVAAMDLASVGVPYGEGRVLPITDIVEELIMVPTVPMEQLRDLQKKYNSGDIDEVSVMGTLEELYSDKKLPSAWLQMGVNEDEREEGDYEEAEEMEERGGRSGGNGALDVEKETV